MSAPAGVIGKAKEDETKSVSKWHKMVTAFSHFHTAATLVLICCCPQAVRTGVAFFAMAVMTSVIFSDHMVIIASVAILQVINPNPSIREKTTLLSLIGPLSPILFPPLD